MLRSSRTGMPARSLAKTVVPDLTRR